MAAAAPRKRTAARKTTAARTAPKSPNLEAFERLRERARATPYQLAEATGRAFVVPGIEPPIEAHWPKSLAGREAFHEAARSMNFFAMLRTVLTPADYARVLSVFDQFDDSGELLIGLTMAIIDHFNGAGAGDAPGGSTPS
ncbi:MAG TPA: hypothetical protein VK537_08525 [Galbitalea sp.]|nr:hypothetical protein [Galbitalea sp.]